ARIDDAATRQLEQLGKIDVVPPGDAADLDGTNHQIAHRKIERLGVGADQRHPAAAFEVANAFNQGLYAAGRQISDHAGALAVGELLYFLRDRFAFTESNGGDPLGIDFLELFKPSGVVGDGDDPRRAHGERGEHRTDAGDAGGAIDDYGFTAMQARALQPPLAHSHLSDFAPFVDVIVGTEPNHVGRGHAAVLSPETFLVAEDAFRSSFAPLGNKSHYSVRETKMLAVGTAKLAIAASNRAHDNDAIADAHVHHVGTPFDYFPEPGMADDHRQKRYGRHLRGVLHGIVAHVQIAVIESGAQHANQYLAGLDVGNRHLVDAQQVSRFAGFFKPVNARRFHRALHGKPPSF